MFARLWIDGQTELRMISRSKMRWVDPKTGGKLDKRKQQRDVRLDVRNEGGPEGWIEGGVE